MRSLLNMVNPLLALAPVVATDDTVLKGIGIDRLNYESALFTILTGVLADTDATFAVKLQESDDDVDGDYGDVAASDMDGTVALASFTFATDNATRKIAYVGQKRWVRVVITPTGNGGNAPLAAVCTLGHPDRAATPNPPA